MENPKNGAEDYTILLNNLANSYKNQNRFDEAIKLQTQSLKILEVHYSQNPDRWANDFVLALIKASYIDQVYLDTALEIVQVISNELYKSEALPSIAAKINDKELLNRILEMVSGLSVK